ncbi:MAG: molybdopterin converting factor subunit 1 [Anaerolineales bacterium]|nr:molybdopterin converting factor subunit 1 [Anaerolineales bacterium]
MNKISVLFFATFRDKAGTNRAELQIPEGTTIEGLREILVKQFPGLDTLADHAMASINKEFALDDQIIPDGSEVAWFPPVAGG